MREKFTPAVLAATISACAHSAQLPSISSSKVEPTGSDAVDFCDELQAEQMVGKRIIRGGYDALFRSVMFIMDETIVNVNCVYRENMDKDKKPRVIEITAREARRDGTLATEFEDNFTDYRGAPGVGIFFRPPQWNPDGCIDRAEVDISGPSQSVIHRVNGEECRPPYAHAPRDQEEVALRAGQHRFDQITSAARALLNNKQLLFSHRK